MKTRYDGNTHEMSVTFTEGELRELAEELEISAPAESVADRLYVRAITALSQPNTSRTWDHSRLDKLLEAVPNPELDQRD